MINTTTTTTNNNNFAYIIVILLICTQIINGITVRVEPNRKECFMEEINESDKALCTFSVVSGGYMDVDVQIYGPDDQVVFEEEKMSDGSLRFRASQGGRYKLCFSNEMSTVSAKVVSFNFFTGHQLLQHGVAKKEHFAPLEGTVLLLAEGLRGLESEQRHLKVRQRYSTEANMYTNSRVVWWSVVELIVLVAAMIGQMYYTKHMLENKGTVL